MGKYHDGYACNSLLVHIQGPPPNPTKRKKVVVLILQIWKHQILLELGIFVVTYVFG